MKQSEKLDLILRELYKTKNNGKYYSIGVICSNLNIPIDSYHEYHNLAKRLEEDRFVKPVYTLSDCRATLTSHGIEYCEENSYSYSGHSIVTNNYSISIVNSPNTNVVNQSQNVTITQTKEQVNDALEKIREIIITDLSIDQNKASEILDCLNEIQEGLKANQKPKFAIKSLLDIAGGISSVASWLTILGQFGGIIPIL